MKGNEGDIPINVKPIEAWEAELILNILTRLSGQAEIELAYIMEEATILAGCIKQGPLIQSNSEIVYRNMWIVTLKYYFPITRFTHG